jgi:serine protease Do
LIAAPGFRTALEAAPTVAAGAVTPQTLTAISLPGALTARGRSVGDAIGSVVLISAGQAEGSGFLVSSDGLLLTDQHVVGAARYVKVRWSDGFEGLGEVVRSDRVRDVALVKTDPRGRPPIRLRRDPMQPGDTVFAIGAPLGDRFQGTVTRGVVSAYRTFEGESFIQSDVSVNPGSSGGPLLDEAGEAVGLTESRYQVAGAPTGINLFVPVGDALDFLNAHPK